MSRPCIQLGTRLARSTSFQVSKFDKLPLDKLVLIMLFIEGATVCVF